MIMVWQSSQPSSPVVKMCLVRLLNHHKEASVVKSTSLFAYPVSGGGRFKVYMEVCLTYIKCGFLAQLLVTNDNKFFTMLA